MHMICDLYLVCFSLLTILSTHISVSWQVELSPEQKLILVNERFIFLNVKHFYYNLIQCMCSLFTLYALKLVGSLFMNLHFWIFCYFCAWHVWSLVFIFFLYWLCGLFAYICGLTLTVELVKMILAISFPCYSNCCLNR